MLNDTTQTRTTAAEFLALPETTQPMQLIEGEIIVSPSPVPIHQKLLRRLSFILETLITEGEIYFAPMDVFFDELNVTQPDMLWIAPDGQCRVTPKRLEGAPDLIIEILSPSTANLDRTRKFRLYERHGVSEYWLVDPNARLVEVFSLVEDKYSHYQQFASDETLISPRLGASLDLTLIWKDIPGVTTPPE